MAFVLRLVLALFLIVGGAPTSGAVTERTVTIAAGVPCHEAGTTAARSHRTAPVSHQLQRDSVGHCTAASGVCCSLNQVSADVEIARLMIDAAWVLATDTDRTDRPEEPATPPPRA